MITIVFLAAVFAVEVQSGPCALDSCTERIKPSPPETRFAKVAIEMFDEGDHGFQ